MQFCLKLLNCLDGCAPRSSQIRLIHLLFANENKHAWYLGSSCRTTPLYMEMREAK